MLRRRFYYHLKPYLPWSLRMGLRRWVAQRKRKACAEVWPVNPATAAAPPNWPGWPEGKKFAFVLTHDVEGPDGLDRCRGLAELEMSLGFRASYNFIPEGPYVVPPDLRGWLKAQGFEVGVHDLQHDGHLFSSPQGFEAKAERINAYLRDWDVAGFRSGFMLHNLDWLHQLNIAYDCSTFDTDPFEPQPDDVGTIFPFWVPKPPPLPGEKEDARKDAIQDAQNGAVIDGRNDSVVPLRDPQSADAATKRGLPAVASAKGSLPAVALAKAGYVELPYTLPQDSTLFLLLRERTNTIWRDKLDWVAQHGGMVLLNTHPDYMAYSDRGGPTVRDHYIDLLNYVKERYTGVFWHALPGSLASFVHRWEQQTAAHRPTS